MNCYDSNGNINKKVSENTIRYDPRVDPMDALNLHREIWYQSQRSPDVKTLVDKIEAIHSQGLVAVIENSLLSEVYLEVCFNCDFDGVSSHIFIQNAFRGHHWVSLCICMLGFSACESFPKEEVTRFYKSESDGPVLYGDILEWKPLIGTTWRKLELKAEPPVKKIAPVVEPPETPQLSLF